MSPVASSRRLAPPYEWSEPAGRSHMATLAVRTLGHGRTMLLLHGLVGSGRYWGGAYDALARHRRLVVPDLLGFGRSPRPVQGYGPDDHVAAIVACLDELGATDPAVVGAHSAGALIALRLAAMHPERVAAVVAFGPPAYPDPHAARARLSALGPMARLMVLPTFIAAAACAWVCNHQRAAGWLAVLTHPDIPAPIAADSVRHSWQSYSDTLLHIVIAAQAARWLEEVRCPVRLVAGDADPVVDRPYLATLARLSNVTSDTWQGARRSPPAPPCGRRRLHRKVGRFPLGPLQRPCWALHDRVRSPGPQGPLQRKRAARIPRRHQ